MKHSILSELDMRDVLHTYVLPVIGGGERGEYDITVDISCCRGRRAMRMRRSM